MAVWTVGGPCVGTSAPTSPYTGALSVNTYRTTGNILSRAEADFVFILIESIIGKLFLL